MTWCGHDFDHWLDTMTIPRLRVLKNVWKYDPPMPVVAARYVGVKARPKAKTSAAEAFGALAGLGFTPAADLKDMIPEFPEGHPDGR